MSSSKEQSRLFSPNFDNKEPVIASAGTEITLDFVSDSSDTATTYNFNLGGNGAYSFVIRPSATILIKKINGRTLTNPITVTTTGWTDKHLNAVSMLIETTADNTSLKVFARGGN